MNKKREKKTPKQQQKPKKPKNPGKKLKTLIQNKPKPNNNKPEKILPGQLN